MSKNKRFFSSQFILRFTSVHSWIGICAGMLLFIAFFAGALTMYQEIIQKWANPTHHVVPADAADIETLIRAAAAHPDSHGNFSINLEHQGEGPTATFYGSTPDGAFTSHTFGLGEDKQAVALEVPSNVGYFINRIHFTAGLPTPPGFVMMGVVSAIYGLALTTGLLIQLPHLVRDLYALRTGKNLKKMWMDAHNVIGILSLPFHIMFALTAMLLCLYTVVPNTIDIFSPSLTASQAYAMGQGDDRRSRGDGARKESESARMVPMATLVKTAADQIPGMELTSVNYSDYGTRDAKATVSGRLRNALISSVSVDLSAVNGDVVKVDVPGTRTAATTLERGYIALHYGDFGGHAIRALYFFLGLAGAFLFYTGNLLWIETRRKHRHEAQPMSGWRMAQATVGICLGCCVGIGVMLLGTLLLPLDIPDYGAWEERFYFIGFFVAVAWAFARPPIRAGIEILYACAALYALPAFMRVVLQGWSSDWEIHFFELILLLLAMSFAALGHASMNRARKGQPNSVWSLTSRPAERVVPNSIDQASA